MRAGLYVNGTLDYSIDLQLEWVMAGVFRRGSLMKPSLARHLQHQGSFLQSSHTHTHSQLGRTVHCLAASGEIYFKVAFKGIFPCTGVELNTVFGSI